MPNKNKRKRKEDRPRPTIHPRNKYSDNPPDFTHLASLYPSFKPFVFYFRDGRPRIDWTDFNATRELTRILLLHDHGINWWIPDGQLCPTVPNRSNYINWIEDLLSSEIIPKTSTDSVRGFDIGTGANCIYPLLGASLLGWSFLGSDVTDVALEWAERNVKSNPHVSDLIEIRRVGSCKDTFPNMEPHNSESVNDEKETDVGVGLGMGVESETLPSSSFNPSANADNCYCGPPILLGVIKDDEKFDFCMCNPPFFESMEEAGLNPKTSCGGTPEEMICPGGEKAFIIRIIEDSVALKQSIRWYTSMVGRKSNLKFLISKLHKVGVTIVKTTEFVQGQTSRWGLAWSFVPPAWKLISAHITQKNNLSFMLEGLHPQFSAIYVLQSIESFFLTSGASCKLNDALFSLDISASNDHCNAILKDDGKCIGAATSSEHMQEISDGSSLHSSSSNLCFRISVFQQIPGTLLVKGSLQHRDSSLSGLFSPIFQQLEELLKSKICR